MKKAQAKPPEMRAVDVDGVAVDVRGAVDEAKLAAFVRAKLAAWGELEPDPDVKEPE